VLRDAGVNVGVFQYARAHRAATHCNTLHNTATQCTTLQHTAPVCCARQDVCACKYERANSLRQTAPHCNTLQTSATACCARHDIDALEYEGKLAAMHNNTLRNTAAHCETRQHTATYCNTPNSAAWFANESLTYHTSRVSCIRHDVGAFEYEIAHSL